MIGLAIVLGSAVIAAAAFGWIAVHYGVDSRPGSSDPRRPANILAAR
jgi:hypothetical protein